MTDQRKSNLFEEIKEWGSNEFRLIKKEKDGNKNISFTFSGLGGTGEQFAVNQYPSSIGSSSKGGCAFDNKEYNSDGSFKISREVKFLSLDGTKICKQCESNNKDKEIKTETKLPCFQTKCIFCNGDDFKYPRDSRWGISAKAHIDYHNEKYKLNEYILYISEFDHTNNSINLKCFKIMSSNNYFTNYIQNQFSNGKGDTCNLMPYSWDFYMSGPIELFNINIYSDGTIKETTWDLDNTKIITIPKSIIISNKKNCLYEGDIPEDGIEYESVISFCSIKKKSLGKARGNTSRK